MSLRWVTVIWLTHILSEATHRLHHVEPWAEQRLQTLRGCIGQPVPPRDVSDDRWAAVLEALSAAARWTAFEGALNHHTLRVYDLGAACVRLDSTTANGHWTVTDDGLCQFGQSQDQRADDPLYIPAITRVREGLGRRGLWSGGEGQMGALETRAFLPAGGDDDLGPLSERQRPPAVRADDLAPVGTGAQAMTVIHRPPQK